MLQFVCKSWDETPAEPLSVTAFWYFSATFTKWLTCKREQTFLSNSKNGCIFPFGLYTDELTCRTNRISIGIKKIVKKWFWCLKDGGTRKTHWRKQWPFLNQSKSTIIRKDPITVAPYYPSPSEWSAMWAWQVVTQVWVT